MLLLVLGRDLVTPTHEPVGVIVEVTVATVASRLQIGGLQRARRPTRLTTCGFVTFRNACVMQSNTFCVSVPCRGKNSMLTLLAQVDL
jgi:hypothetical protein